jgi:hypothetical protein
MDFLKGLKEDGKDPQALRDRPVLTEQQVYYHQVFSEVTESRNYSAGGTPLPISGGEILSYFETFYITGLVERERLHKMIRAMDRVYVKVISDKAAAERKKTDK